MMFCVLFVQVCGVMVEMLFVDVWLLFVEVVEWFGFSDLFSFLQVFKCWYGVLLGVYCSVVW